MKTVGEVMWEILHKKPKSVEIETEEVLECMDEWAQLVSVDFFKWNAKNIALYMDYLRRVDNADGISEKEIEANRFEGATIDQRFEMYKQEKLCNPTPKN